MPVDKKEHKFGKFKPTPPPTGLYKLEVEETQIAHYFIRADSPQQAIDIFRDTGKYLGRRQLRCWFDSIRDVVPGNLKERKTFDDKPERRAYKKVS